MPSALEKAKNFFNDWFAQHSDGQPQNFDALAIAGCRLESIEPGRAVCRFRVTQSHTNAFGTLNGGCIATLVDAVSTGAVMTTSDYPGASVTLSVTYLLPVPLNEDAIIVANVIKCGKSLATIEVEIKLADGRVAAKGVHTKFLPLPPVAVPSLMRKAKHPLSKL